jgi:hypothetical protein
VLLAPCRVDLFRQPPRRSSSSSHARIITPDQWRKRAEEMRRLVEDLRVKAMLLRIAEGYELEAKRAERRQRVPPITDA